MLVIRTARMFPGMPMAGDAVLVPMPVRVRRLHRDARRLMRR